MRGHEDAAPIGPIGPAVIRAFERAAGDDFAERQPGTTVDAQVAPREVIVARAPQDDVLAQKTCAERPASRELVDAGHRVPIVDQDGIVEHLGFLARR